ncbi:hypothetical protein [Yoonia sediminilitoris]|uniref:hypothetical protein n=1 Tax=Yoonia sediminilitoris TaxID=1286148 RepID=UPI001056F82C|nr:hypothetical protein [Yoonia sediminilitoris]
MNRDKHQIDRLLKSGHPVRLIDRFSAAPLRSCFGVYAGTNPQNRNSVAFLDLDLCDASIFSNAPEFASMNYRSAASAAIRDRRLTNEPSTSWTTKATVEEQLGEIISGELLDQNRICALQDFYHARISEVGA